MNAYRSLNRLLFAVLPVSLAFSLAAQAPDAQRPGAGGPAQRGPGQGGPGMMGQQTKLVEKFDKDGDKHLNAAERKAARQFLQDERAAGRGPRGFGGRGGRGGENQEPPKPGPKVSPADVKSFPNVPLYDPMTVRTCFLEFESADWEKEMTEFNNTDVEIPAKLTVDGKTYPDVGVHFRGASSFGTVGEGFKRSLNVSLDFVNKAQNFGGYRTLEWLNSHTDPSFLRSILYYQIAREYLPAPKANFVRVVINGESWGIYVNKQQFNKEFIQDYFGTTKGARWKVPGSPGGRGNLLYLGEDVAEYRRFYTIRSKDEKKAWADLIKLCKILKETSSDKLEAALAPIFNVDGALKFLALENTLINNDGYWIRTSDYMIYQDEKKRFHIIPHDANETFGRPGGPRGGGGRGGPGAGGSAGANTPRVEGVKLDPLTGADDPNKPLISKLLAVPALRERYLGYVRDIADKWLDWQKLGPIAQQYHTLIESDVKADTRKLYSMENFEKSLAEDTQGRGPGPFGGGAISLKNFADQRRAYLLNYREVPATAK